MNTLRTLRKYKRGVLALLLPAFSLVTVPVYSNPAGANVVAGGISISNPAANHLLVTQSTQAAVIDWQSFSISGGETTQFLQPNSSAIALNRVVTGDPSAIYGTLKANGNVIVINPNGIVVGAGGMIDVAGLTLSTLDMSNEDFLNGGANSFYGGTANGVANFGTISSSQGDVIIMGGFVNNEGQIGALNGTVALGAGGGFVVSQAGGTTITVQGASDYTGTGVNNSGTISAATADLKSHGNVFALAINNSGVVRATGSSRSGGRVRLTSSGGSSNIVNNGSVSAVNQNGSGGDVQIDAGAGSVDLASGDVKADGVGSARGGDVSILGRAVIVGDDVSVTADGGNGGAVNVGNGQTESVTTGQGSMLSASGNESAGGRASIATSSTGTVDISGDVAATGARTGGAVSVAGGSVNQQASSTFDASARSRGGTVRVDGIESTRVDGRIDASAPQGYAGDILVTADDVTVGSNSVIAADGYMNGGRIRVGGEFQGRDLPGFREANTVSVEEGASLSADAEFGDAGSIAVWANNDTIFRGSVSASARGLLGDGGLLEISGMQTLTYEGIAEAISISGRSGTILFDPGDITVGLNAGVNRIRIEDINDLLQGGTSVVLMTEEDGAGVRGNIIFEHITSGGYDTTGNAQADRHQAIQWTNSAASFGAFASGSIIVNNHIRTSGGGSINLMAGWDGQEADLGTLFLGAFNDAGQGDPFGNGLFPSISTPSTVDVQSIFDHYVNEELFGNNGGITVGSDLMSWHVEVGSRFGNTNLAGSSVTVKASDTNSINRYAQIGFHDNGVIFGPRLNNSGGIILDMRDLAGERILTDGTNGGAYAGIGNGVDDPVVGIVGQNEVDMNGDGIMDGVRGVDSSGVRADTFIPYANHFNSSATGNWWWQQIEDSGNFGPKDGIGLGGLRPEYGAGGRNLTGVVDSTKRADINIISTGTVTVEGGSGRDGGSAMIGHGGFNHSWGGDTRSTRSTGDHGGQLERRWSMNGSTSDRQGTAIARLAPVRGNINVLAGVDTATDVSIDHVAGTVSATMSNASGDIIVRGHQELETSLQSTFSFAQIGHGAAGQSGQFYGDIHAEAGGKIDILGGTGTRSHAAIGHVVNGYSYYRVSDNEDQQIRFFATLNDQRNPNLRRGELFSVRGSTIGTTGFNPDPLVDPAAAERILRGADSLTYGGDEGSLRLAPLSAVGLTVDALDGSIATGFHGDITVKANAGNITIRAGTTPLNSDPTVAQNRDRRFAKIGHGGASFTTWSDGAGYYAANDNGVGGLNGSTTEARETVRLNVTNTLSGGRSGSASTGTTPGGTSRSMVFMTITGDVSVDAGGDVSVTAGNDVWDYAQIGHGGTELADTETSSFVLGDILINAGGDLTMISGGSVQFGGNRFRNNSTTGVDLPSYAQIGHGGTRTGIMDFTGDIEINVVGNFTSTAGAYYWNYAQVGHGGIYNFSQAGGDFSRTENYWHDNVSSDLTADIDATGGTVTYAVTTDATYGARAHAGVGMPATLTFTGVGDLVTSAGSAVNTSNININVGGNVLLNHLGQPNQVNPQQQAAQDIYDATAPTTPREYSARTNLAWNLIGHGGLGEDALREGNPLYDYGDKIGNVSVISGGSVIMQNGNGSARWTRIGHGLTAGAGNLANFTSAVEMVGNITVSAALNVSVNAAFASANGDPLNTTSLSGFANPSTNNLVAIGHGGTKDNRDVVVLGSGEDVHGIAASSDIVVTAGGDMEVLAGKGLNVSFAQVGHGYGGDGNDRATLNGVATGFTGDITVNVTGDLKLVGSPQGAIPSALRGAEFAATQGSFAAIGHGGYELDAPSKGNISVFVGNNLDITAQQRIDPETRSETDNGLFLATYGNFAKIGHVGFENGGAITDSNMSGDIVVVVANDMTMRGGTSAAAFHDGTQFAGVVGAFSQVGHGGPGIEGDVSGDITVLVGNNLTTFDGHFAPSAVIPDSTDGANSNYVMIGNGDWLRDGSPFSSIATGARSGDISVLVGETATLDHTLIGHADPSVGGILNTLITSGNTQVGVSRNNPFFGGAGELMATNGTVFTSAGFGSVSRIGFYMPARENNKMDGTTRINEETATFRQDSDASFADAANGDTFDTTRNGGLFAGRSDEVYLTPDLWWDNDGEADDEGIPGGGVFPVDLAGVQGGAIALVGAPGGISELTGFDIGGLGTSGAPNYRGGNGVSGAGQYTLFFDAILPVSTVYINLSTSFFNFAPYIFGEKFDSFDRNAGAGEIQGGGEFGLYSSLGAFEGEEATQEGNDASWLERALDNQIGSRKDPNSGEEEEEADRRKQDRGLRAIGPVGLTFYVFDPGTNRFSSYRVFGVAAEGFYPTFAP